jgi:hypothetical protein
VVFPGAAVDIGKKFRWDRECGGDQNVPCMWFELAYITFKKTVPRNVYCIKMILLNPIPHGYGTKRAFFL